MPPCTPLCPPACAAALRRELRHANAAQPHPPAPGVCIRNVASEVMDLNHAGTIDFRALGGADNIVVHDLSGQVVIQLVGSLDDPMLVF